MNCEHGSKAVHHKPPKTAYDRRESAFQLKRTAMPNLGAGEWLIILLVIVILFGSAKLPSLARSLGKSMRILKAETKGLHNDDDDKDEQPASQEKGAQQSAQQKPPGQLPAGEKDDGSTLNGVPLTDSERARRQS
jgi:sec-independent protein translocase protein TatA